MIGKVSRQGQRVQIDFGDFVIEMYDEALSLNLARQLPRQPEFTLNDFKRWANSSVDGIENKNGEWKVVYLSRGAHFYIKRGVRKSCLSPIEWLRDIVHLDTCHPESDADPSD